MSFKQHCSRGILISAAMLAGYALPASAADTDLNYSGPLLTPGATINAPGVLTVEPYLMYYSSQRSYDDSGVSVPKQNSVRQWQLLLPFSYGLTDRVQLGLVAGAAHTMSAGSHTTDWGATDVSVGVRYVLLPTNEKRTTPQISVDYWHRFPTGIYDRLDENPLNGLGNGAQMNNFALNMQQYLWLANGRPIRFRASANYGLRPAAFSVHGRSTYGTSSDFHGSAQLGSVFSFSTAAEYTFNAQWGVTMDLGYSRAGKSMVRGTEGSNDQLVAFERRSPSRNSYSVAPAVEYNFNSRYSVIGGVQYSFAGRNNDDFITPMVAVNIVF